jgi:hypothetical protein
VALGGGDSVERHFMDTIQGGKWLPNQDMAWRLCEQAVVRIRELENEIGCFFDRNGDGSLHQKAFAGQTADRTVHKGDLTGIEIINRLMEQVLSRPVEKLQEHRAIGLIPTKDGSALAGVLMIDMRTGKFRFVRAKTVLMATGGGPTMYKYHTPSGDKTMDGLAMALRAGLPLRDMEMVQFHPTGLLAGDHTRMTGTVLEEGLRGAGGQLVNYAGQRFMFDYDGKGERATRDVVSRGIYSEMRKNNNPDQEGVFISMSHLGPDFVREKFKGMVKRCADSGFDLDVSGLQAGNTITLEYTDTLGVAQTVTLMAVSDPSLLPLDNTATSDPNDTVYGFDISSGLPATYITNINAALGSTGLLVSNNGSDELRVLGDSGAPTSVESLTASVTVTADSDQGLGLSIFVDQRAGTEIFTDALEDGGQRVGYAGGISVNPSLLADSALLVNYKTTPTANTPNDPARPQFLLNALNSGTVHFDPSAGIGSTSSPFEGTVIDYVNNTIAFQGNQAEDAKTYATAKETLTTNLAIRYEESYSVNLDTELAFMVQLENAYAANARVMQTIKELFDELLRIV